MIASDLKQHILATGNYVNLPGFPGCVESLTTLEELVRWLGNTDFSATHSGLEAAVMELIRTANSLRYQEALYLFAIWAEQQQISDTFFAGIVTRDVRHLKADIQSGRSQEAFEAASSLAVRMVKHQPALRPHLAERVLSLTR